MLAMSTTAYKDFLSKHKLSDNKEESDRVKRVGKNIKKAVEKYFKDQHKSKLLKGYKWEFNLVEDPAANAWCMPGGKVVVYTGILKFTQTDAGLATVLGHEIAHAVAGHGAERMSQSILAQLGGTALSAATKDSSQATQAMMMQAYGVGVQVGALLPYSRLHESEADHLGLIFMAMAGYDPHEAIKFWERMAAASQGQKPPELMSTHPSDARRIQDLKRLLPEAMRYYKPKK